MNAFINITVLVVLTYFRLTSGNTIPSTTSDFVSSYTFAPNLTAGLEAAKLESKPLILLVHYSRCNGCIKIRDTLTNNDEIKALSKKFIVVSSLDSQDPEADNYAPDGFYVPRLIFFQSNGTVLPEIACANKKKNIYSYSESKDILRLMRKALELNTLLDKTYFYEKNDL